MHRLSPSDKEKLDQLLQAFQEKYRTILKPDELDDFLHKVRLTFIATVWSRKEE